MPPAGTPNTVIQNGMLVETSYPSRNIAYNAASMITSIIESLQSHDQLRFTPAFMYVPTVEFIVMRPSDLSQKRLFPLFGPDHACLSNAIV